MGVTSPFHCDMSVWYRRRHYRGPQCPTWRVRVSRPSYFSGNTSAGVEWSCASTCVAGNAVQRDDIYCPLRKCLVVIQRDTSCTYKTPMVLSFDTLRHTTATYISKTKRLKLYVLSHFRGKLLLFDTESQTRKSVRECFTLYMVTFRFY